MRAKKKTKQNKQQWHNIQKGNDNNNFKMAFHLDNTVNSDNREQNKQ